ncbi:hypothetical protein Peur_059908 [Populus x canadensis]
MDVYGGLSTTTAPDYFHIDDLLDFSNDDLLSSPSSSTDHHHHLPPPETSSIHHHHFPSSTYINNPSSLSTDFTDHLSVPTDDVAELEWLSQFVEDSFSDFPSIINIPTDTSFCNKSRSKRSRATATTATSSSPELETAVTGKSRLKKENNGAPHSPAEEGTVRRCTHCASEKTPQWRTGPLGPKTLCNACGVRVVTAGYFIKLLSIVKRIEKENTLVLLVLYSDGNGFALQVIDSNTTTLTVTIKKAGVEIDGVV